MTTLFLVFAFGGGDDWGDGGYTSGSGYSNDCPILITFAQALNVDTKQPTIMTQLNGDCCLATGITCSGSAQAAKVVQIDWNSLGLDGVISNMTSLSGLVTIDLSLNSLTGTLPALPTTLYSLFINGNFLTGAVPTLPVGLKYLWLGDTVDAHNNQFTGMVTVSKPFEFRIQSNRITDVIITNTTALTTGNCVLDYNPLIGSTHIAALTMCSQNGIYSLISSSKKLSSTKVTSVKTKIVLPSISSADVTSIKEINSLTMPERTEDGTRTTVIKTIQTKTVLTTKLTLSSTIKTGSFMIHTQYFSMSLRYIRVFTSWMIFAFVFVKSPFKREFKKMMKKKDARATEIDFE